MSTDIATGNPGYAKKQVMDCPPWIIRQYGGALKKHIVKHGDFLTIDLKLKGEIAPDENGERIGLDGRDPDPMTKVRFVGHSIPGDGGIMISPDDRHRFAVFRAQNFYGGPL